MTTAEVAPAPTYDPPEAAAERLPHFGIPGFEKLPRETQELYLKIPPDRLDMARPIIEDEIKKTSAAVEVMSDGETDQHQAESVETNADTRETQAEAGIATFHRAEAGDPRARADLLDLKRELFGEEPSDDEIFATILETESGNPFAQDTALEVALSDAEADAYQNVLDLFKEFRGDLPSVDDALRPELQIKLFLELTKGGGNLPERMHFVRHVLAVATQDGARNLRQGLTDHGVVKGGDLVLDNLDQLKTLARNTPKAVPIETAATDQTRETPPPGTGERNGADMTRDV